MAEQQVAVWTGRFQPPHVGHLEILRRSLRELQMPHCVAITSYAGWIGDGSEYNAQANLAYSAERNPLTEWERVTLMRLALQELVDGRRVTTIVVPRHDWNWEVVRRFYPPNRLICLTDKDEFEDAKLDVWARRGEQIRVFKFDSPPATATEIRTLVSAGRDWRSYLPASAHEYFELIEGPRRVFDIRS